ncbi:copper amine oxidase [Planomicrobium okeanokoites]|uniref:copper amine oxidase n=1 Tax=Planomicrobium okeanokoites TaxID=244 RepID=UPI0035644EF7
MKMNLKTAKKTAITVPMSAILVASAGAGAVGATDHDGKTEMDKPTIETPALELRTTLGHFLSEHGFLAVEAMRSAAAGEADFEATAAALSANTEDLTGAIASVYGEEAGQSFNDMWSAHIGYFVDYVQATDSGDEAAKQAALDELDEYRADFSSFLEGATGERLKADALAEGLQMHVNQLIGAFESYVAGDYEQAYAKEREAIEHLHGVAKGLSVAITNQFPDKFEDTKADTPAGELRAQLGYLLSEHAGLATVAMQNGVTGAEEFEASAAALSNNTEELSAAIASVYGDEAGQAFNDMWAAHIGYFVDYTKAVAAGDDTAKQEALDELAMYKEDFSAFIENATGGEVPAEAMAEGLQMHIEQLTTALDLYAAEDYDAAFEQVRVAYGHMYGAAENLSGGIVNQNPDKFRADMPGMPETGMGGTADSNTMAWMLWAFPLFALAGGLMVVGRKEQQQ